MTAAQRRRAPAWYTPVRLPEEFALLDRPIVGGLPVGAPGKVGLLEVVFARRGGTTRVEHQYQQAPLHVYRPIHLDENVPEMAFVFVQQFGDGYVHGDRCRIDVDCGPGTAVHVTTQAASNVYRTGWNFASQLVNLYVGREAVLEYLPDPVVPFRGSRFFQRTCLRVDADATAILGDMLLPGRAARGELHQYELYRAETEALGPDETLLFADALRLCPGEGDDLRSLGLLGPSDVVANLYLVTRRTPAHDLADLIRAALSAENVLAGVSELPNGCGVSVRILGSTSKAARLAFRNAWSAARLELLGAPAPELRKG